MRMWPFSKVEQVDVGLLTETVKQMRQLVLESELSNMKTHLMKILAFQKVNEDGTVELTRYIENLDYDIRILTNLIAKRNESH